GGNIPMHDFVRDFATSIARRDKHVFLRKRSDEELPTSALLNSKNRSLKIPDTFFEGMGSLRVLDLTSLNLSSLPTSFRFLTNLKTLCLDLCILENMDAIEGLQNLEILRIWKSSMIKFPREIGRLTQLRMLDLSNSGIEVLPPNILSSLIKLEELYMGNTSINWEDVNSTVQNGNASIAELHKLPSLTALELQIRETWMLPRDMQVMFEKLNLFKIAIGDVWDWADIKDGTLKTLMLKLGTNIHLEHGIKSLIKGVENLYLDDVDGIQNVLYNLSADGFPLLKHLHIQNNANMKHIVDSKERNQIQVAFPNLDTIKLSSLLNLNKIWDDNYDSMHNLTSLIVDNCGGLKYLFSSTVVGSFNKLKHLEISNCAIMEEIIAKEEESNASKEVW
ncbi:putative CC-NBS-LRR resistance protein, partial [Trifolium pratense]